MRWSVDMQRFREVSRTRTIYSTETHTKQLVTEHILKWELLSQCSFYHKKSPSKFVVSLSKVYVVNLSKVYVVSLSKGFCHAACSKGGFIVCDQHAPCCVTAGVHSEQTPHCTHHMKRVHDAVNSCLFND